MKRIRYEIPRWSIYLHRAARGLDSVDASDPPGLRFADELYERLLTASEPELLPESECDPTMSAWAERVHATCSQLPDFDRLADQVRGDPDAAAVAVETLLDALKPEMDDATLRRATRSACARGAEAVEELRDAVEGLEHVAFGRAPGSATATGQVRPMPQARSLAQRLRSDARLKKIAQLAGRFRRIAATKRRMKVKHGADEISDVEQGADLGRLLPVELAKLVHPRLRLAMLRDFLERRCLQYQLSGVETLGKGPLVLLKDVSGSMEGDADLWATAVALALLDGAQRERRPFALLAFNGFVVYEAVAMPGDALPEAGLFVSCSGGTNIDTAVRRGLDIIEQHPGQLRKADIVLITDGASDATSAAQVRAHAAELGVEVLGVGIGVEPAALSPWCAAVEVVSDLTTLEPKVADGLFNT